MYVIKYCRGNKMIPFIIICGVLAIIVFTNMLIFLLSKLFHKNNYKLTHPFYYLLSFTVIFISVSLIGLYATRTIL